MGTAAREVRVGMPETSFRLLPPRCLISTVLSTLAPYHSPAPALSQPLRCLLPFVFVLCRLLLLHLHLPSLSLYGSLSGLDYMTLHVSFFLFNKSTFKETRFFAFSLPEVRNVRSLATRVLSYEDILKVSQRCPKVVSFSFLFKVKHMGGFCGWLEL